MTCCSHPKCGLHLDDAVGSGALQLEAMVQSQVRRVQQTGQGQRHHAQWALILRLLHLVAQHQRTLTRPYASWSHNSTTRNPQSQKHSRAELEPHKVLDVIINPLPLFNGRPEGGNGKE